MAQNFSAVAASENKNKEAKKSTIKRTLAEINISVLSAVTVIILLASQL